MNCHYCNVDRVNSNGDTTMFEETDTGLHICHLCLLTDLETGLRIGELYELLTR